MKMFGAALVFYMQHFPEMSRYHGEQAGRPNSIDARRWEEIARRIDTVGRQAAFEAADLLEACAAPWHELSQKSRTVDVRFPRRAIIERNRYLEIEVRSRARTGHRLRQIGIYLDDAGLTPWVWSRGGRVIEARISDLLQGVTECRDSRTMHWPGGSVALPTVRIAWGRAKNFRMRSDAIIKQTRALVSTIDERFLEALVRLE